MPWAGGRIRYQTVSAGPTASLRRPLPGTLHVGFIGLGTFEPNIDAVTWFLRDGRIRARVPGIRFRLAGKGFDPIRLEATPGVDVLGEIADPTSEDRHVGGDGVPHSTRRRHSNKDRRSVQS